MWSLWVSTMSTIVCKLFSKLRTDKSWLSGDSWTGKQVTTMIHDSQTFKYSELSTLPNHPVFFLVEFLSKNWIIKWAGLPDSFLSGIEGWEPSELPRCDFDEISLPSISPGWPLPWLLPWPLPLDSSKFLTNSLIFSSIKESKSGRFSAMAYVAVRNSLVRGIIGPNNRLKNIVHRIPRS